MTSVGSAIAWDQLLIDFSSLGPCPSMSIIIPTYRSAHRLPVSLDSLSLQKYPNFEVILIDASSDDRTLEDVQKYNLQNLKIFSVVEYDYYSMLNRGISAASGKYINFLRPGDFYLSAYTLLHIARMGAEQSYPDIVYCGSLQHDRGDEPQVMMRELKPSMLKKGIMTTTLQSCWFLNDSLVKIGGFNTRYQLLGDFDLLCRFGTIKPFKFAFIPRVLVDDERRRNHYRVPFRWMQESFRILFRHFGLFSSLLWFFRLKPKELFSYLWSSFKNSVFIGK